LANRKTIKKSMSRSRGRNGSRSRSRSRSRNRSRKNTLSNSKATEFIIKPPTKTTANKLLAIVLRLNPTVVPLTPLTENELRKLCSNNDMVPPAFKQRFTNKGFLTTCLFLKQTYQNKPIFDICIELFPILYGITLTPAEIAHIDETLKSIFDPTILEDKNNENVEEIKGGTRKRDALFNAFSIIILFYNGLCTWSYKEALVIAVDDCVNSLTQFVNLWDRGIKKNTGKSMEYYLDELKGDPDPLSFQSWVGPALETFGTALDYSSFMIYTEEERNKDTFKENQTKMLKYVELGYHICFSNDNKDDFAFKVNVEKEKREEVQYRKEVAHDLTKVNRSTKKGKQILDSDRYTVERNKKYTDDSIEDLQKSWTEVIKSEKIISKQLKEADSPSNTKLNANNEFDDLTQNLDILFDNFKACLRNLDLRTDALECEYPVQAWKDIKSSNDFIAFASDNFAIHAAEVAVYAAQVTDFVNYALYEQGEIIQKRYQSIEDQFTAFGKAIDKTFIVFKQVKNVAVQIPSNTALFYLLWNKLKALWPILYYFVEHLQATIIGLSMTVYRVGCAFKSVKRVKKEE
jgi:hypothetical protein